MAKKTLVLTEDHLKLVTCFLIENGEEAVSINKTRMLFEQSHLLDDVSLVLGLRDKAIPNTGEDADGLAFPDEIEKYMVDTYKYVRDNLFYIETLLHQNVLKGGIVPGTYECDKKSKIWEKIA